MRKNRKDFLGKEMEERVTVTEVDRERRKEERESEMDGGVGRDFDGDCGVG